MQSLGVGPRISPTTTTTTAVVAVHNIAYMQLLHYRRLPPSPKPTWWESADTAEMRKDHCSVARRTKYYHLCDIA
jgi:hypothetical protein